MKQTARAGQSAGAEGVFAQRSGTVGGERTPKNMALGTFPDAGALLPQDAGALTPGMKLRPRPQPGVRRRN
jgi:hypothetical protein